MLNQLVVRPQPLRARVEIIKGSNSREALRWCSRLSNLSENIMEDVRWGNIDKVIEGNADYKITNKSN